LLTAQTQLATDKTLLPELHQEESTARHALAILLGKSPAEWTTPELTLNDFVLPGEIVASLPSELVHRRPDILAAEAQLHAASAAIGVATANLYPNITLSGTLTQQALTPGGLFNGAAAAWAIAANLTAPLYDAGRLRAERRAAADGYQAALADYRQTILRSFGDVADGLQALSNDDDQFNSQTVAAQTAAAARDLARRSYASWTCWMPSAPRRRPNSDFHAPGHSDSSTPPASTWLLAARRYRRQQPTPWLRQHRKRSPRSLSD
jgi:NodT family efflux transporter outer membrane factor (OMF) lipoprotein